MIDKIVIEADSLLQFKILATILEHYGWYVEPSIYNGAEDFFENESTKNELYTCGNFTYGGNSDYVKRIIEYQGYSLNPTKGEIRIKSIDQLKQYFDQKLKEKTFTFTTTRSVTISAPSEEEARQKLKKMRFPKPAWVLS